MKLQGILLAALVAVFMTGCTEQAQSKYDQAGEAAAKAADKTGEAVATDAKVAGEAVENATEEAQQKAKDAETTTQVKAAILAADDIDAKDINVDTSEGTVFLRGSVRSEKEKDRAQKLAEGVVGDKYKINNELQVNPSAAGAGDARPKTGADNTGGQ